MNDQGVCELDLKNKQLNCTLPSSTSLADGFLYSCWLADIDAFWHLVTLTLQWLLLSVQIPGLIRRS